MLTARGWWFLFWTIDITLLGVIFLAFDAPAVPILAFTFLIWIGAEWVLFLMRIHSTRKHLTLDRQLFIGERELPALWAGTSCKVRVRIALQGGGKLPFVALLDKLTTPIPMTQGNRRANGMLSPDSPLEIEYTLKPEAPGIVRFEGVEVRCADLCGLFYYRLVLRAPVEYLVLPPLADDEGHQRATKRFNTLPPPGVHRLKRPGGGSELLDLRDYRPGDPPKMIAWKASARRDRLITKEFENDIPVRCVVFLDSSNGTRLGEPGTSLLSRYAAFGATIAQAASANRDLVGLVVFDDKTSTLTKPARTRIHTMQLLRTFAETAGKQPEIANDDLTLNLRLAHSLAQELYPDLLDKKWNTRPFGLFWIPLLDTWKGWLLIIPIGIQLMMVNLDVVNELVGVAREIVPVRSIWSLIPLLIVFGFLFYLPMLIAGFFWFLHGIRGIFAPHNKRTTKRKQLGALFASLDDGNPAAIERHLNDDEFFTRRCQKFLADHHLPIPPVLYDDKGNYLYAGESKLPILANALVRSVSTARDNELYVILADLVELDGKLDPLLRSIRAARARHHQVVVILIWPQGVPLPPDPKEEAPAKKRKSHRDLSLNKLLGEALFASYHRKYAHVRTALVKNGAEVVRVNADEPVQLVLERFEQLRHGRIRR